MKQLISIFINLSITTVMLIIVMLMIRMADMSFDWNLGHKSYFWLFMLIPCIIMTIVTFKK